MQKKEHTDRFPATVASTLRLAEGSRHYGQWNEERDDAAKSNHKEYYNGDSWFASATVAEQLALQGHEFMGPVSRVKRNCSFYISCTQILLFAQFIGQN